MALAIQCSPSSVFILPSQWRVTRLLVGWVVKEEREGACVDLACTRLVARGLAAESLSTGTYRLDRFQGIVQMIQSALNVCRDIILLKSSRLLLC